jgi:hypothetical protein
MGYWMSIKSQRQGFVKLTSDKYVLRSSDGLKLCLNYYYLFDSTIFEKENQEALLQRSENNVRND